MTPPFSRQEFTGLTNKYLQGKATAEEILFLEKYYDYFNKESATVGDFSDEEKQNIEKEILTRIWNEIETPAPVISIFKRTWFRVAAAAIIILLGASTYFFFNRADKTIIAKTDPAIPSAKDVAPGGNKAVLTLANNTTIILDSTANGFISQEGNTKVVKLNDGQLAYNKSDAIATEFVYNTISTPRGGEYQVILSDGTKVKLNAASSLHFPTQFSGKERKVEITGEAYFEVAENAVMPFKVAVSGMEVEVLGTHFNVSAYDDEKDVKTTLAEGKVKITSADKTVSLSPGQQSTLTKGSNDLIVTNANVDKELAWVNGLFEFDNDHITGIMRQLSRWYDVEVIYSGTIDQHYGGTIPRGVNISKVLHKLELAGGVKFLIEGKKVTVKSI